MFLKRLSWFPVIPFRGKETQTGPFHAELVHHACKHDAPFTSLTRVLTIATSGSSCGLFGWRSGDLLTGALGYLFTPCLTPFLHGCACGLTGGFLGCGLMFFSRGFWSGWLTGLRAAFAVIPLYRSTEEESTLNCYWPRRPSQQSSEHWSDRISPILSHCKHTNTLYNNVVSSDTKFCIVIHHDL